MHSKCWPQSPPHADTNASQCLTQESGGRNCKLRRPCGHRLALAPSSPNSLNPRSMTATVQLDFKESASASQGESGVEMTPWAQLGLGALVPDPVAIEVDVGDRTVGLQGIRERLSEKSRGRNCKLRRPCGHRLALAPSSPNSLNPRSMTATVQLDFKESASASQGKAGSKLHAARRPRGNRPALAPWSPM